MDVDFIGARRAVPESTTTALSRADTRWRRVLVVLGVISLVQTIAMAYMSTLAGDPGFATKKTGIPFVGQVVVARGGAADAAGLRNGDMLDARKLQPAERYRLRYSARAREPMGIPIERSGSVRVFTVVPNRAPVTWDNWLSYGAQAWLALFCILLAWRRPESREVRTLVLFLLGAFVLGQTNWLTPYTGFDAIADTFARVLRWCSVGLVVVYAGLFGRPLSVFRHALAALAYGAISLTVALTLINTVAVWSGLIVPITRFGSLRAIICFTAALPLFAAIAASRGANRTQVIWATAAVAPLLLWVGVTDNLPGFGLIAQMGVNLGFVVIPIVLTYSLFSRRLVDIGFIVNRAAIFTTVSVVLIGAFVLAEWLLTEWLREASHATNVLASAGLALGLGLSVRFVHLRVDRFIDNIFFRKRHEDEQAITTFAQEAPYITDRSILLDRSIAILARHTDATSVDILLDDGAGHYGSIGENDPAIVRLRATHRPVDLHGFVSDMRGDLAFPMVARGHLRGVIVLGPRRSGESYAPDEAAAIAHLAHSLGAAIDVLSGTADGTEKIVASIEALRAEIALRLPTK